MNSNEVSSSSSVRDLGLIIDSGLTLATHVSIVARNCFYQLRRIRQAKKGLDEASVRTLVQALVLSRLDYCNSILANLPDVTLAPLVRVQHSAARLIRNLTKRDSVLPVMMELHWLPLRSRITFKLCVLMHGVHYGSGPKYLAEMVVPISSLPGRERLRSSGSLNYDICRTRLKFTEHSFAVSGPTAWNSLPLELKQTSNVMKFKKLLKSHLFLLAYSKLSWNYFDYLTIVPPSDICRGGLIKVLLMMMMMILYNSNCWCTTGHFRCKWRLKWR